jgi:hypothetical protein
MYTIGTCPSSRKVKLFCYRKQRDVVYFQPMTHDCRHTERSIRVKKAQIKLLYRSIYKNLLGNR